MLDRIRATSLAFPETSERLSHGAPTFFFKGKRAFAMVLNDHHGDGRFAIWCAAEEGMQAMLVSADPESYFVPPYAVTAAGSVCASTAVSTPRRSPGFSRMPMPRWHCDLADRVHKLVV